ncbi:permease-like cell division protein FtsX [Luteimonas sp BLCC-B24]|uniref:permease-like cell division protein FtsX n=1 Tax=Luteimonas sp. BLCC-B24 TaxID=3025317 RepID=UPI00234C4AC1|nr:permease-like cell division protein FtsX [Luteimonas sp. BLCC-B24]MDC7807451.1 permease-like cell division protein FtsX [Luteimonas sp. BLCC-B24]
MPEAPRNAPARAAASPVGTWADHHAYSVVASLGRLFHRPWSTALTIGVMAVALALPLGLWLVLDNLGRLGGSIDASREISVFLDQEVEAGRAQALAGELRGRADVGSVVHRTPDEGLAELRERGQFGDAIDALDANPLPHVLILTPSGDERLLVDALRALPEAELVQHDTEWRQRLDGWLRFGGRVVWVLGALLGLGALLVVGNTVRLDIQARREELGVLQLLGATDGFIRRPFLYLGAWYGLSAGAVALALLAGAAYALQAPLAELAASYGAGFALRGFGPLGLAAVLGGATALGWLGAGLVTGHFLRQTRPTDT